MRALAKRQGYAVRRSRRSCSLDNAGEFRLVDVDLNCVVMGERYGASLDDISGFLQGGQ